MLNSASLSLTSQRNNRDELEIDVHTHKIIELACLVVAGLVMPHSEHTGFTASIWRLAREIKRISLVSCP